MVSKVRETRYVSEPAPYPESCRVNMLWSEVISPTRAQFMAENSFEQEAAKFFPCDEVYFSFESEKIEYSAFWMQPHNLYFAVQIDLNVPKAGIYPFVFSTCGGAKVFVNDVMQGSLFSYVRNCETEKEIHLSLTKGSNVLYVLVNDLAERDTQFYCKVQYTGEPVLEAYLPRVTNPEVLEEVRTVFLGMHLKKFNYQNFDIDLHFAQPLKQAFEAQIKLVFTDSHTATTSRQKTVKLLQGTAKIYIGDLVYKKVGMVSVFVEAKVGDVSLSRKIDFEYYDETIMPTTGIATIKERKAAALQFLSQYGLNDFQKVLCLKESGIRSALAEEILDEELFRLNERYDCSDFRMPALIYAYHSARFTLAEKEKIRNTLLQFRYWFSEKGNDVMWFFSENHALNFHAAEFLAGETFADDIFANSGFTGEQHQIIAKQRLLTWFENFFNHGYNEWNSSVYIPIDMIAFFALYDMAKDAQIKALAKKALDKTFGIFGANSYRGIVAASYGRIYFKNLIGRRTSESTALNFIANGEGWFNQHGFSTTLFALSSYEPPAEITDMYHAPKEGKETKAIEGEEQVQLYSFKTPDYIMGSIYNYHPGCAGLQEHVLQIMLKDCDTQIWINHPGEASYFGEGRPSYFAGNGTLPLVEQNKNFVKVTFHLREQAVKYTHAFCPLAQFDYYCLKGKWMFLKKENVYVAIYADNGIEITKEGALKNYELVSQGKNNFWQVLVDNDSMYGTFENFVAQTMQNY